MRSFALMSSLSASSLTVTPSVRVTLPVGRLNSSTLADTGAACFRASRRAEGSSRPRVPGSSPSTSSGMTMSGPRSSLMIWVPENGPLVKSWLSTSCGRSLLPRLPVPFFLGPLSSSAPGFLRRIVPPLGEGEVGRGGVERPTLGRSPGPPLGPPAPPGPRMPMPGPLEGRAPIGALGLTPGPPGRAPIGAPGRIPPAPAGRGAPEAVPKLFAGRLIGACPA